MQENLIRSDANMMKEKKVENWWNLSQIELIWVKGSLDKQNESIQKKWCHLASILVTIWEV
jgi:hypothetical protein